jgi:hypothetical protein
MPEKILEKSMGFLWAEITKKGVSIEIWGYIGGYAKIQERIFSLYSTS